ncbi:hypothetical protein ACJA88_015363 [Fusarium oxysporum]
MPPLQTASKKETADAFLHLVQSLDPLTLVVYSDGSLSSQGAASYGFTIHQGNFPVLDGSGRLGPAEVFDAEAAGALEGLRAALTLQDSATQDIIPEGAQPTLAYLRRIARQKPKEVFETWWSTSAPEQYKRLNLKATTGCPPELSLPRAALHHLLAARSLHGDFAAYHERFDHSDAHLVCSCNRRKAPDHVFYCRKVPPRHRKRLAPLPNAAVNLAIGKDFTKFAELSKASAFFQKICPRY